MQSIYALYQSQLTVNSCNICMNPIILPALLNDPPHRRPIPVQSSPPSKYFNLSGCLKIIINSWFNTVLCSEHQFFVIQFDPDISVCSLTQKCLHLHEVITCSLTAADSQCINPSSSSSSSSFLLIDHVMLL